MNQHGGSEKHTQTDLAELFISSVSDFLKQGDRWKHNDKKQSHSRRLNLKTKKAIAF